LTEPTVLGVVAEWDDDRGLGVVRADDGRDLVLQCTSLADGSRTTEVGTRVSFTVAAGHHGRWQAIDVEARG
jgi:cold shock CspA family protein